MAEGVGILPRREKRTHSSRAEVGFETEGPSSLLQKGKEESRQVVCEFPILWIEGSLTDRPGHIKKGNSLAHLHFCHPLSWAMASLWPVSPAFGGIARQKHRPIEFRISNCGFRILGFLFQSAFRNRPFAIPEARPVRGMEAASWFFAPNALAPGPGTA
jgi:hypothetical protein